MKLKEILTEEVDSTFVPLSQDAEGSLKGGYGSLIGTGSPYGINASNNCLCENNGVENNCSCPTLPKIRPTNNCNCPEGGSPYEPILDGNNCTCRINGDTNNCSCKSAPSTNNILLPSIF